MENWFRFQLSSVAQSCPTVWDSTDCNTPGFPVHHQLPELKLMSIELVMPSNHLILCLPLLLLSSVFPMNIQDWSHLGWTGLISLQSKGLSRVFSNTTVQKHQFFSAQLSLVHRKSLWKSEIWAEAWVIRRRQPGEHLVENYPRQGAWRVWETERRYSISHAFSGKKGEGTSIQSGAKKKKKSNFITSYKEAWRQRD